ncbi:MAG: tetratricopeptide repeat protein [Deltaproteobacteria bacterium]|nr:tetratricopeptide repeat protein [Deltaproteobacteria bacterium]
MTHRTEQLGSTTASNARRLSVCFRRVRWTAVALGVGLPLVLACGRSQGRSMTAADPERQAEAECDVARDLFVNRGQPRAAISHALKAMDLNQDNAEAAHLTALIYLYFCATSSVDCHLDKAEKYARLAVKNRDGFREAQNTLGVVLVHQGRYDDAISVLKPLTQDIQYATPENAWGNLGWAFLLKGEADRAIETLRQAVALQPEFCVGQYRLGLAYEKKADFKSARDFYSRALETDRPECKGLQDAYAARARVSARIGAADDARSDLERCRQLGSDTPAGRECAALAAKLR